MWSRTAWFGPIGSPGCLCPGSIVPTLRGILRSAPPFACLGSQREAARRCASPFTLSNRPPTAKRAASFGYSIAPRNRFTMPQDAPLVGWLRVPSFCLRRLAAVLAAYRSRRSTADPSLPRGEFDHRPWDQTDYEFLPGVPSGLVLKRPNMAGG